MPNEDEVKPIKIPTDLKVPDVLTNPPPGEMPKRKRKYATTLQIDAALAKHTDPVTGTDRNAAAAELGMAYKSLSMRILKTPFLLSRWSKAAKLTQLRDELINKGTPNEQIDMTGILHQAIDGHMRSLGVVTERIIEQINALEKRIRLHEEAFYMDESDPKFKSHSRFLFRLTDKGEPQEERFARESLQKLYTEYRQQHETGVHSMFTKARVSAELTSRGTQGRGPGSGKPKGLGMAPKGNRPVMPGTTLIDARGANVLVQNGNGSTTPNGRPADTGNTGGAADLRPAPTGAATAQPGPA